MDVEEDDAVALAQPRAVEARERTSDFVERADGDVSRNNRIRDSGQAAVPQVHVGAADLGADRAEQRAARCQIRFRKFTDLDRPVRRYHDGGKDGIAHAQYSTLFVFTAVA
jgi:hypothetical protein